jgi:hypothetical protein
MTWREDAADGEAYYNIVGIFNFLTLLLNYQLQEQEQQHQHNNQS